MTRDYGMEVCMSEVPTTAGSCRYQGYEFGAGYLDSVCVNGQLFDADNCDANGALYEPLNYFPCPVCRPREAVLQIYQDEYDQGKTRREALAEARRVVSLKLRVAGFHAQASAVRP